MPPKILDVSEFDWDDNNIFECAGHGITPALVNRILAQSPLFFLNQPEKSGTHVMIGPAEPGGRARLWTIVLLNTEIAGRWRPNRLGERTVGSKTLSKMDWQTSKRGKQTCEKD